MIKRKTILVTGASQGLGFEISKRLLVSGYNIGICSKNLSRLNRAYKYLLKLKKKNQKIFFKNVDLTKQLEVKNFIKSSINKFGKIHGLINNAGILGPKGKFEKLNINEWKRTIDTNLYASIYTCLYIVPHFKKNKGGKIIQLSGAGALSPMENFTAYSASKAAVVRFADTLSEELKKFNIQVNSVAAGAINTQMIEEIIQAGAKNVGNNFYRRIKKQKKNGGIPFKNVTELILYLLKDEAKFLNGKIISPKWDNWKNWKNNKNLIKNTEVYTLRRFRGKNIGYKKGDN